MGILEKSVVDECRRCFFYRGDHIAGICRRYPPLYPPDPGMTLGQFPKITADQWCGEWKPDGIGEIINPVEGKQDED